MGLISIALLLFIAVVALLVTVLDALGRVLVAALGAIARAPWRGRRTSVACTTRMTAREGTDRGGELRDPITESRAVHLGAR